MTYNGAMLVDKAAGMTSHDVVDLARRKIMMRKIGHTGTLDPGATGLLILLLGNATKQAKEFMALDKTYEVQLTLGITTRTADGQGQILDRRAVPVLTRSDIEAVFRQFHGIIEQIPPMVSAKKINGKRLYALARKNITVERSPQRITIHDIAIDSISFPRICFRVRCSKGTYIRTLCEDIGKRIGCGAHMSSLRRTACGTFHVAEALSSDELSAMLCKEWEKFIFPLTPLIWKPSLA